MSQQQRGRPLNNEAEGSLSKLSKTHEESREASSVRHDSEDKLARQVKLGWKLMHHGASAIQEGVRLLGDVCSPPISDDAGPKVVIAPEYNWSEACRGPVVAESMLGLPARVMTVYSTPSFTQLPANTSDPLFL